MDKIFELSREMGIKIGFLFQTARNEILAPHGLTGRHAPYLVCLGRAREGRTQAECSRMVHADRANTTRVVRDLVEKGFAERSLETVKGARVRLTERGVSLASELERRFFDLRSRLLAGLTDEEKELLFSLLNKIERSV